MKLESKYGSDWGGWVLDVGRGGYGVCLWKYICLGWNRFSKCVTYSVGKETRVHFWLDWWCIEGLLKDIFPDLYGIARAQWII